MQRSFLRAARVPPKNGHRECFSNGYGSFDGEPMGKGEPVAQRIREKTSEPISKRVITRFPTTGERSFVRGRARRAA
jgi:hypothetical protein